MPEPSAIHNTFVVERNYPKPPAQVFAAFADATKKLCWFGQSESHDVEDFQMDFRVGGRERLRYRFKEGTPFQGLCITNEGAYFDIVPDSRLVTCSSMTFGDKCISVSLVTFELLSNGTGTDLICTHQGTYFEGADGLKFERWAFELSSTS